MTTELAAPDFLARLALKHGSSASASAARAMARTLDLDLLDYRPPVLTPDLELPHPRRRASLRADAALRHSAQWRHPRLGLTAAEMLARLPPGQPIRRLTDLKAGLT